MQGNGSHVPEKLYSVSGSKHLFAVRSPSNPVLQTALTSNSFSLNPKLFSVTVEFSGLSDVLQGLGLQFPEILYSVSGFEHLFTVNDPV